MEEVSESQVAEAPAQDRTLAGLIEQAQKFMAEAEAMDFTDNYSNAPEWVRAGTTLVNIKIEAGDFTSQRQTNSIGIPWSLFYVNKHWYETEMNSSKVGLTFPNCLVVAPPQPYFGGMLRDEVSEHMRILNKYFYQVIPIKYFKTNNTYYSWNRKFSVVPVGMKFTYAAGSNANNGVPVRDYILFGSIVNLQDTYAYGARSNVHSTVRQMPMSTMNTVKELVGAITEDLLEFAAPYSA